MNRIGKEEIEIIGKWIEEHGDIRKDEVCERIEWLIDKSLKEIASDISGWDILYMDKEDGRYWELTYPDSEMQGGGPPKLSNVDIDFARKKYNF
ncbi:MAG: Imm27 family immunity protein [Thermoleophilia bacterium]